MSGKATSKLHEKHQTILANMLREEENKFCADCLAKGPRWASWNLGVFLCIRCAGIHRNLGVHISRVKSVNLDSWTPEQIEAIQKGGNGKAKDKYEANLPSNFRRPQDDYSVEQFIRNKYERKLFISKKEQPVAKATETPKEQEKAKGQAREPKKTSQKKEPLLSVPRPASHTRRSSTPPAPHSPHARQPAASLTTPLPPMHQAVSAPDLMSLEAKKQPQPVLDLLTGLPATSSSSSSSSSSSATSSQTPSLGEGSDSHTAVKDNILSLYNAQPSVGYTVHGHPVHSYYYQQQQQAAMRMAQQQQAAAAMRMAQVKEVEEQMRQLKMRQSAQVSVGNGQPAAAPQPGGQTLSPHLW